MWERGNAAPTILGLGNNPIDLAEPGKWPGLSAWISARICIEEMRKSVHQPLQKRLQTLRPELNLMWTGPELLTRYPKDPISATQQAARHPLWM